MLNFRTVSSLKTKPLHGILVCLVTVMYLYWETVISLVGEWMEYDQSMGHGFLVFAVCVFLVYKSGVSNEGVSSEPNLLAVIPLFCLTTIWAVAELVDINIIQQMVLPLIFLSGLLLLTGRRITWMLLAPVLFIYFAIPFWDYLNNLLVDLTSFVVQNAVKLSGITAFVEGNSIFLASGEIQIASGCSGIRYLIIGLFLGAFSGYMYFSSFQLRVCIVLACCILAILANWVRVYSITIVADITSMQSSLINDHETLGWIIFMLFMLPLFYFNYMQGQEKTRCHLTEQTHVPVTPVRTTVIAYTLFFLTMSSGPVLALAISEKSIYQQEKIRLGLNWLEDWTLLASSERMAWKANFSNDKDRVYYRFKDKKMQLELAVFIFYRDESDGEILPYIASIHDPNVWSLEKSTIYARDELDTDFRKNQLVNKYSQEKLIMAYQYRVGKYSTSSYKLAKFYQVPATILQEAFASLTVVSAMCIPDCAEANDAVNRFLLEFDQHASLRR